MSDEVQVAEPTPGALAIPDISALQNASAYAEANKELYGSRTAFLPRLQLFGSTSEAVKEGKIPIAHYGIIKGKDDPIDLGISVLIIPLAWRAKAMDVKVDPPMAYHKPDSPEFQEIKKRADNEQNSGCMYGPEFLVWMAEHGYVTFFFGSKTARNEAPAIRALLPKGPVLNTAVCTAHLIKTEQYSWHGIKATASAQQIDQPPTETIITTITDFLNPKDSVKKEAAPVAAQNADR